MEPEEVDEAKQIAFWWQRIEAATKGSDHQKHLEDKKEAQEFYMGDQMSETDEEEWGGDLVVANLFRRTVNFITDSVYSHNPNIKISTRRRRAADIKYTRMAEVIREHLEYIWEEEGQKDEVKTAWKDAYFGNLSGVMIDFDKQRGLFRGKWIAGEVVCDPEAHGDSRRARWLAIRMQLPKYRVWQDSRYDKAARMELKDRQGFSGDSDASSGDDETADKRSDIENIWYIITKEGIEPLKNEDDTPQVYLLVMAENFDKWLLKTQDPTPYLDADEFSVELLRIDQMPGKFKGPAMWRQVGAVCKAFNWAASYHMEDMRKTASRAIAYDEDRLDDPSIIDGRSHMVKVPVTGDPKTVVSPIDLGQADKTIFDSVHFWSDLLDKLTGIDEIARGEEGVQKTATESEILQKNSSITMRGPTEALDKFMSGMVKKIALASLYYTPAFSVVIGPQGVVMTKQKVEQPEFDQMSGMPVMDEDGQPVMTAIVQEVPVQWTPEEAAKQGAQQTPEGLSIMANKKPGEYILRGIDYFHGEDAAMDWPDQEEMPFESIKCELNFKIEAGSTQAAMRAEKRRNAQRLLETVGLELKEIGAWEQFYEVITEVAMSLDVADLDKKWISKEDYVKLRQQQAMLVMQAGAGATQPSIPESGGEEEGNSPGTMYPSEAAG